MSNQLGETQAVVRLAFVRQKYPELVRAEAAARLRLAAAIIALDEVEDRHQDRSHPGLYSLAEQAEVEAAKEQYVCALADLLRGEANSAEGSRE